MGAVTFGAPERMIRRLAEDGGARCFIEGGTHIGGTARWASSHFEHVWTIEGHPQMYERGSHLDTHGNVKRLLGNTKDKLPEVLKALTGPAVFWLDAHWCGPQTFQDERGGECPILEELEAVGRWSAESGHDAFVLVDDARLFLAPPPPPHDPAQWPDAEALFAAGQRLPGQRFQAVWEDVFYSIPDRLAMGLLGEFHRPTGDGHARVPTRLTPLRRLRAAARLALTGHM